MGEKRSVLDTVTLINAFPYFAMVMDDRHHVIEANSWFLREASEGDECPLSCFGTVHGGYGPHSDCPLVESIASGRPVERVIGNDESGRLHVSVYPLSCRSSDDRPLFLHLARAV